MQNLPEVIFTGILPFRTQRELVEKGQIKKLLPRVYTSNLHDRPEDIVKRNWLILLSGLFPGALLSFRTAIEFQPSPFGNIYLTHNSRKVIKWPGLTVRMTQGHGPLQDDNPISGELFVSSLERASLENLSRGRTTDGEKRTLGQGKIEGRLVQILSVKGEEGLNVFKDRARTISNELGYDKEFITLSNIISSILSTHPSKILTSPVAMAAALGEPYDVGRLELFRKLVATLKASSFEQREAKTKAVKRFQNFAFFEAYFSNYIEGTTFEIEEAREIIYNDVVIPSRTGDSHDIKSTYVICADQDEMNVIPRNGDELLDILKRRHSIVLQGRPEKKPGTFKIKPNRAGSTHFVNPNDVIGTLKRGHDLIHILQEPLSRAIYIMFLVSEVHPFDDGNGRIARIMMNAELVHSEESKIIIPTVYREDYLLNLKKLTREEKTYGFVRMLDRIHAFSHGLQSEDFESLKRQLMDANAFKESDEAAIRFLSTSKSSIEAKP